MNDKYIIVTDYIKSDTMTDLSVAIQDVIDANPNRTIFFPDGEYYLEHPILTSAHPKKSVDLQLSNFACFKASANWSSKLDAFRANHRERLFRGRGI